jgi:energy-coupling factor transporter ATP-binding protein EcfA2
MSGDDKRAAEQSRAIDKELAQAKKKATKEVKLLLLGAGASGKSTVAKQMHILYLNGFGESELIEYKQQVATNMVNNMRALLLGARKLGNGPPSTCFYILFLLISFHFICEPAETSMSIKTCSQLHQSPNLLNRSNLRVSTSKMKILIDR